MTVRFGASKDVADLTGKVVIVTGSTAGLGYTTAQVLVRKGAKVYLAARDARKAKLDLDDPKSAKSSAEEFLSLENRLDVLINNAAMVAADYRMSDYGIQQVMIINYFSPFVFTETLLPLLKKTDALPDSDVRIVNFCFPHLCPGWLAFPTKDDFNLHWLSDFAGSFKRYGLSKLADNLWSRELQHGNNITSRRIPWPLSVIYKIIYYFMFESIETGVGTSCIAAGAPQIRAGAEKFKGAYLVPYGVPSKQSLGDGLAKELRDTTEQFLKEWGIMVF